MIIMRSWSGVGLGLGALDYNTTITTANKQHMSQLVLTQTARTKSGFCGTFTTTRVNVIVAVCMFSVGVFIQILLGKTTLHHYSKKVKNRKLPKKTFITLLN